MSVQLVAGYREWAANCATPEAGPSSQQTSEASEVGWEAGIRTRIAGASPNATGQLF